MRKQNPRPKSVSRKPRARLSTIIVADAASSFDAELHAASLRNFAMKFGWLQSSAEVIAALG